MKIYRELIGQFIEKDVEMPREVYEKLQKIIEAIDEYVVAVPDYKSDEWWAPIDESTRKITAFYNRVRVV